MNNLINMAMQMIQRSPNVANNPNAQHMIDIIRSGNAAEGERIADNLCKTYGCTREQAITRARQVFGL